MTLSVSSQAQYVEKNCGWKTRFLLKRKVWVHVKDHIIFMTDVSTRDREVHEGWERLALECFIELAFYFTLLCALLWTLYSFYLDSSGAQNLWFQRSGAVLVAAALTAEVFQSSGPIDSPIKYAKWLTNLQAILRLVGIMLTVCGTLIWAYGDMLTAALFNTP